MSPPLYSEICIWAQGTRRTAQVHNLLREPSAWPPYLATKLSAQNENIVIAHYSVEFWRKVQGWADTDHDHEPDR